MERHGPSVAPLVEVPELRIGHFREITRPQFRRAMTARTDSWCPLSSTWRFETCDLRFGQKSDTEVIVSCQSFCENSPGPSEPR